MSLFSAANYVSSHLPLDLPALTESSSDSEAKPAIRATRKAAAWRAQISRAYAYQLERARSQTARDTLEREFAEAMESGPDFARVHKGSEFTQPPLKQFDPREAQAIMKQARAIERGTYQNREKGAHGGVIGKSALRVLETLLFVLWPLCRRGMFPSLEHIAAKAQLSVRTVQTSLAVLKLLGFVTIFRRMKRVATALGQMVQQDSNAYLLHLPKGWGAIGASLFSAFFPDGKNFQAKESIFISKASVHDKPNSNMEFGPEGASQHALGRPYGLTP